MTPKQSLKLFEGTTIRTIWDSEKEEWFFSVADVCNALSGSQAKDPNAYWRKLKQRLKAEGSEVVTNCHGLKLEAADGKKYLTDVLSTRDILRLIQSIPSPKAEPLKMWLAQVGNDRLEEIADPEKAILRGADFYRAKGYSEQWINQRMISIEMRKELTDEWKRGGIQEGKEFAMLTDIITKAWSGKTTREYKRFKGLKKENLRDNMTNEELVLNMLAELSTTSITKAKDPQNLEENMQCAAEGGEVARVAREQLESKTGRTVVSPLSAKRFFAEQKPIDEIENQE